MSMTPDPRYRVVGNPHGYYRIQERVPEGGTFLDKRGCERTATKEGWYAHRNGAGDPISFGDLEVVQAACAGLNGINDLENAGPWEPVD